MISYSELESRLGTPIGVEDARAQWGALVGAAEQGQVTLVTRERWEWAALVPLSKVPGLLSGLPVVSLSTARAKLGDLVRQVAQPYDDSPVLLARHRNPVAALVAATRLIERGGPPRTNPAEALLLDGCTVTLSRHPAGSGFVAVARDAEGAEVAVGTGDTVETALRTLG
ncbi:MAG: type II toxin-antitoxin system Phd/YefM family antitoxin [Nonomuraea sp.]|nr:type II toxin-antitoxin system Phd/YefM family antitoxin [Nonomuraea sp.]NUP62789.1 type II toxin-antitoxin system Phd/YefM family antitoxin [Nonomuraea sp.]NUP80089.1 type II toxin-antitoxin system Phd/YefM family antitoxin [Nonomuraea sp.]